MHIVDRYNKHLYDSSIFQNKKEKGNSDSLANYSAQDENAITWSLPFKILFSALLNAL